MRLWHHLLLRALPGCLLRAQHRDCCALRGRGWGKRSPHTRHVHDHSFSFLVSYHRQVVQVMIARGYKPDLRWMNPEYRGRFADRIPEDLSTWDGATIPYPEHTPAYFLKCVAVLRQKVLTKKIPVEDRVRMDREIDSQILAFVDESK